MKRICNAVEGQDLYSAPYQVYFKQDSAFKSRIGGCTSIILLLIVVGYSAYKLNQIFKYSQNVNTTSILYYEFDAEEDPINIAKLGFDIAARLSFDLDPKYGNMTMREYTKTLVYNETTEFEDIDAHHIDLQMETCGWNGFNYSGDTHTLHGIELMQCVVDKEDLIVQGTTSTTTHKFIAIEVHPCVNASWRGYDCASHEEIVHQFSHLYINVRFLNSYVDFDNMTDPRAVYVEDSISVKLDAELSQQYNYKVQINDLQLFDNLIFHSQTDQISFAQIESEEPFVSQNDLEKLPAFKIEFSLDSNYFEYTREVFNLIDLFEQMGGFWGSIVIIGQFIMMFCQDQLMYAKILSSIYYVNARSKRNRKTSNKTKVQDAGVEQLDANHQSSNLQFQSSKDASNNMGETTGILHKASLVMDELTNRVKFQYTKCDHLKTLIFPFFKHCMKDKPFFRMQRLLEKGTEKFEKQFDIQTILKQAIEHKIMALSLINREQRHILRHQKDLFIDSDSSQGENSSDEDEDVAPEGPDLSKSEKHEMTGTFNVKVKNYLRKNTKSKLDKLLIEGIYTNRPAQPLEEEENQSFGKQSPKKNREQESDSGINDMMNDMDAQQENSNFWGMQYDIKMKDKSNA